MPDDPIDDLVREATERAAPPRPPPARRPATSRHAGGNLRSQRRNAGHNAGPRRHHGPDRVVRGAVPDELSTQLADALRELLMALRALIDWYIDRLESVTKARSAAEKPVEDIPIT